MLDRATRWKRWLSDDRLGKTELRPLEGRTEFDRDYDRIVFSSSFRRLQDKTQVFPLSQSDYTRTRLTHSMEVACVGRSLGQMAGKFVIKERKLTKFFQEKQYSFTDFGTIVAAACLAHDVGNPPFGHSGEDAIQEWARQKFSQERGDSSSDISNKQDFTRFEGNAQSFRIYSKLQGRERRGGMQLTLAVFGALFKYTCSSKLEKSSDVVRKKFGYFEDDATLAQDVFNGLGMFERQDGAYARHPLAFLMEAADDICYRIIDLEDAYQMKIISYNEFKEALLPFLKRRNWYKPYNSLSEISEIPVLRSAAIHALTLDCLEVFQENLKDIEDGAFTTSLIEKTPVHKAYDRLRTIAIEKVYTNERVLQIECAGYQTIGGLLEYFYEAIVANSEGRGNKLRKLFPPHYLCFHEISSGTVSVCIESLTPYQRLLAVTDYISGMTDRYAVELYQKLSGIKLPS